MTDMLLLDTDHLTVLRYREHSLHQHLIQQMYASSDKNFVVRVISLEEQLRGWLSEIRRRNAAPAKQIPVYSQLTNLVQFFSDWTVLAFDALAVSVYEDLRSQKIRIGSQDLKIASIAKAQGATLLTSNLRDFERVPELPVQDWLYGTPRSPTPR